MGRGLFAVEQLLSYYPLHVVIPVTVLLLGKWMMISCDTPQFMKTLQMFSEHLIKSSLTHD